jgi:RNA polymerase sigma-70 factor (ECF subfamily)
VGTNDDAEIIRKCRAGDERAYRELVDRYRRQVYSMALRMLRREEDAEDVAQETFIRVFRALDRYDPARPFAAWLFTIAARLSIDHIRRRKQSPLSLFQRDAETQEERTIEVVDPGPGPEELTSRGEEEGRAQKLIDSLPPHYRIVVMMRHQQDLSYEEIAEALRVPLGTVKARIHRARALLKRQLEGETP